MHNIVKALGLSVALTAPQMAMSSDLEVTHWWTSGGEAAAVAEFAKAFNDAGGSWVEGEIEGRQYCTTNHHQPYFGRRPNGRNSVEPRSSGRRIN